MTDPADDLAASLSLRTGEDFAVDPGTRGLDRLAAMAGRGSHRRFTDAPVPSALVDLLCAVALSSPTKSDLQQRDIVIVRDPGVRAQIDSLLAGQAWVAGAPVFLVFCGNNRRQRLLHEMRARPFVNDHLDAFFNAAVDAGIALSAFVTAAEAAGLGCCPVSAIRNRSADVARLLALPEHVFPVAGLGLGWPALPTEIAMRLPTRVTVHVDRYDETGVAGEIEVYDRRREAAQPYGAARLAERYGDDRTGYGWSEDKARQYSVPERADFGAFVRAHGFKLD